MNGSNELATDKYAIVDQGKTPEFSKPEFFLLAGVSRFEPLSF
jgi:hypothetical protein